MAGLLDPSKVVFLMCDLQTKLVPTMQDSENLILRAQKLYPKGLGPTIPELNIAHALIKSEKSCFSMYNDQVVNKLNDFEDYTLVLFGIEAHICILQTAIELLNNEFQVHLVTDACSSRSPVDMRVALQRIQQAGAILTTTETVLFELIRSKDSPHFDLVRSMARTHLPDHPAL